MWPGGCFASSPDIRWFEYGSRPDLFMASETFALRGRILR
jgi:hypothetical protein